MRPIHALLALLSGASAAVTAPATFYGGNKDGGTCLFSGVSFPSDVYGTAFSGSSWASGAQCGACLQVTGPKGPPIKVMVVDKCPECPANGLDLFENAFVAIADKSAGRVQVSWTPVDCGISGGLSIRNKSGTSKYWFSMQVINSNNPVSALEVSADGGKTWQSTVRMDYNYFQRSGNTGFGVDVTTVRVKCANGRSVTVNSVGTTPGQTYMASGNC